MRTEKVLWRFALGCAFLLMLAPLTPRTTWLYKSPNSQLHGASIRDAAGWDMVAPLMGLTAMFGLVVGVLSRPRVVAAVFGAGLATIAFGVTAVTAGRYWEDLMRGSVNREEYVTIPASGPTYFAVIATVATGFALVLAISWLKPAEDEW